jgi:hypothetical protein
MMDPVRESKVRAEILHHAVQAAEPAALARLRRLRELRRADADALATAARDIQRKHCLAVVSHEMGFASWEHARRVFEGDAAEGDFGTLLYGAEWGSRLHPWFASYEEARDVRRQTATAAEPRFLLAYKRHFFVAEAGFIEALGLDPQDADWKAIAWDWVKPESPDARRRLYGRLLAAQRGGEPPG